MTTAEPTADFRRSLMLPIVMLGLGAGLTLDAAGALPGTALTIPALLVSGAAAVVAGHGAKVGSVTAGVWLAAAAGLSLLRQQGVVSVGVEFGLLVSLLGGLVLAAKLVTGAVTVRRADASAS